MVRPDETEGVFAYDAAGNLLRQPGLHEVSLRHGNRLYAANGDRFAYGDRNNLATRTGASGAIRYRYDSRDLSWPVRG